MCIYCGWKTITNVTRMREHLLENCCKVPETVRVKVKSTIPVKITTHYSHSSTVRSKRRRQDEDSESDEDDSTEETQPKPTESRTKTVQPLLPIRHLRKDEMSPNEQDHLSSLFSRAVYATAMPLRKFEHPFCKQFFKEVRPTFKVPIRDLLGNKFLSKEYQKLSAEMAEELALTDSLSIGLDGWSNCRRDSIVNILLFTPTPMFLKSIDYGSARHFGTYYAEEASKVINEKGEDNFIAFIMDNVSNMQAAGQIIETKYKHMCWYGCFMHALNLLLSDLNEKVTLIKYVFSTSSKITNEIRDKSLILPIFKEKQKQIYGSELVSLKVVGKSRFGSNFACANALKKNKNALQALCVDARLGKKVGNNAGPTVVADVKKEILSEDFWTVLDAVLHFLEPIYSWLFKVQTDAVLINNVIVCFKQIQDSAAENTCSALGIFDEQDHITINEIIQDRKKFAVRDIHFAANLLDPFVKSDEYLSPDEKERAITYIDKVATNLPNIDVSKVSQEFILFAAKEGHFPPQHLWRTKDVSPLSWWKAFAKNTELGKIAIRVYSPPVSAAAIQGSFSTQGRIHSKDRNRLGTEKSGKLTYLYENYRYKKESTRPEKINKKSDELEESNVCVSVSDSASDSSESEPSMENEARLASNASSILENVAASTSSGLQSSTDWNNDTPFMSTLQDDSDHETDYFYNDPIPSYIAD